MRIMSELPLVIFTVLTGLAAGAYAMSIVYVAVTKKQERSWVFNAICIVLLGLGLLGALFHLGHPERFLNALSNPTSMITQEAYWAMPFGLLMLIDAILLKVRKSSPFALAIIGAIAACGLMTVTSIEYFTSYGVAPWPYPPSIFFFIVGDLAVGALLALAFFKERKEKACTLIAFVLGVIFVITLIIEACVFGSLGYGFVAFAIAALFYAVAVALLFMQIRNKNARLTSKDIRWLIFAIAIVAIVIARFAFYAAA